MRNAKIDIYMAGKLEELDDLVDSTQDRFGNDI